MIAIDSKSRRSASLSRRTFLAGAAGLAVATRWPSRPLAEPAPHAFKHGDFEVMVVSDGHLTLPTGILAPDAPAEERAAVLSAGGSGGERFEPPCNVTAIRAGSDLIVFDAGSGAGVQPTAGKLLENLVAAGIDPASVTKVVFTHGHLDHVAGTILSEGALRFPRAAYHSAAAEWDFWMDKDILTKLPKEFHDFAIGAQRSYGAVKDVVKMVKPGDDIVTGIRVLDTAGHTPGHVSFEVAGEDGLIVVGDAVLAPWVFFPHPEWKFAFDADHDKAIAARKKLLDRAATDRIRLIGFHWAYPGIGHAERKDGAFRYVPAA
jgi:glyoxylase-like metal-dependent hydrolase (beta-lactamase superfamily II)